MRGKPVVDQPSPLDPQIAEYVGQLAGAGEPPLTELTPNAARARLKARRAVAGPPLPMQSATDVTIEVGGRTLGARLYEPSAASDHVIVFLHGGGWVTGDLDTADASARRLARAAGADVLSVDYRLAPEHPFPAALDDARAAVRWMRGRDRTRPLVVAGDSAGGNLAAVCAQGELRSEVAIAAQFLCYPVVDSELTRASYRQIPAELPLGRGEMGWYWEKYVPDPEARSDPRVAPLHSPILDTAAPAVLVLAGHDPLLDEGREYARRLRAAGVPTRVLEYPGAVHGFLGLPGQLGLRDRALAQATAALRGLLFETSGATAPREESI